MTGGQALSLSHGEIGRGVDTTPTAQVDARGSTKVAKRGKNDWPTWQVSALRNGAARGLSDIQIAERVGRSWKSVASKRIRMGLLREKSRQPEPIPNDFSKLATEFQIRDLAKHYHRSCKTICKWRKQLGITGVAPRPAALRAPSAPSKIPAAQYRGPKSTPVPLDTSREARAAQFLRWKGFIPVHQARTADPRADKDLWIVGRYRLTTGELIDKATSDPAWARWAA